MAPRARRAGGLGFVAATVGVIALGWTQGARGVLYVALLPQWVIQQHREVSGALGPGLREAVDGGVVDRTVFAWQHGVIQRQALVAKPIRVLPETAAGPLGGRGRFELTAVRSPTGRTAWTEVEVALPSSGEADMLVLEIGGERNTMTQVLETVLLAEPGRGWVVVPLVRSALRPGSGIPVVAAPFEQPLPPATVQRFHPVAGLDLLVARSPLWDIRNGDVTASGPADTVPLGGGDWREGDRVVVRVSATVLARGAAGLVLGWKDRTLRPDPNGEFPRRSALPLPVVR